MSRGEKTKPAAGFVSTFIIYIFGDARQLLLIISPPNYTCNIIIFYTANYNKHLVIGFLRYLRFDRRNVSEYRRRRRLALLKTVYLGSMIIILRL